MVWIQSLEGQVTRYLLRKGGFEQSQFYSGFSLYFRKATPEQNQVYRKFLSLSFSFPFFPGKQILNRINFIQLFPLLFPEEILDK